MTGLPAAIAIFVALNLAYLAGYWHGRYTAARQLRRVLAERKPPVRRGL